MLTLNQKLKRLNKLNFGETIRKLRQFRSLKAYDLAEKAGVERTYISKIERHNNLPSFFVMKRISDVLHSPKLLNGYIRIKCASPPEKRRFKVHRKRLR